MSLNEDIRRNGQDIRLWLYATRLSHYPTSTRGLLRRFQSHYKRPNVLGRLTPAVDELTAGESPRIGCLGGVSLFRAAVGASTMNLDR
ncbi:hypothetical protein LSAT2_021070 [Lamellibrachia satsuma]|nr:hypothetical protein LSAT2_021070 [Lamellibrachia satsuma]